MAKTTKEIHSWLVAIVAAMIVVCLCSCEPTRRTRTIEHVGGTTFDVIEVDSCEYIIGNSGYKGYMAHKGNCKYCAKRNELR